MGCGAYSRRNLISCGAPSRDCRARREDSGEDAAIAASFIRAQLTVGRMLPLLQASGSARLTVAVAVSLLPALHLTRLAAPAESPTAADTDPAVSPVANEAYSSCTILPAASPAANKAHNESRTGMLPPPQALSARGWQQVVHPCG